MFLNIENIGYLDIQRNYPQQSMRIITLSLLVCFLTLTVDGQKIFDTGEKCPDDEERLLINLRLSNAQMFEDFKRSIYKDAEDIYRRLTTLESKGKEHSQLSFSTTEKDL